MRENVEWILAAVGVVAGCGGSGLIAAPHDATADAVTIDGQDAAVDGRDAMTPGNAPDTAPGDAPDTAPGDAPDTAPTDGGDHDAVLAHRASTYIKASNTSEEQTFGGAVALSADGSTLAVGALGQVSIDGGAGTVYVFVRVDGRWSQQALITPSNAEVGDYFGVALALSADGSTLAIGADLEDSNATGVGGAETDDPTLDDGFNAGAVYIFTREAGAWTQTAYIKASNTGQDDVFGRAVALSADGATLAVGAPLEDSSAAGVGGDQTNDDTFEAGAAYVFVRNAGVWSQQAYVKASNPGMFDAFGESVALSGDGATLAVGAPFEESGAAGIDGDQTDNSAEAAGAAYVFTRVAGTWRQQSYLKSSHPISNAQFGGKVSLSGDGALLAVAAAAEDTAAPAAFAAGAAYMFARAGGTWSQQASLRAANPGILGHFGVGLALAADGATLAVGAPGESSPATGTGGDQAGTGAPAAGAAYVFTHGAGGWSQQAYVKASNTGANDGFGIAVALSGDGSTLAAGAWFEDSNATGVDGDQTDDTATDAGAVYVY